MLRIRRRSASTGSADAGQAKDSPQMSLSYMRTALNALPGGVVIYADDGSRWWMNRAAYSVSDLQRDTSDISIVMSDLARRALSGETAKSLVEVDGPPGRTFEISSGPLINGGALVLIDDITDRTLTDRVRTDFVANISHELKTPVGALSILAETLEAEMDATNPELAGLARRMVEESERVSVIIDDLLELASIEFGGPAPSRVNSLMGIVREGIARVNTVAASRGIEIKVAEIEPDVEIRGDRRQLVSAVANLVDNAVKYSEKGDGVYVYVNVDNGVAAIAVEDEGPGIPSEHLDRIFERFYRVDQARSRETGGTGLGLAIVRHIATNHGGEVTVGSMEGKGSTFILRVPV